MPIPFIPVPNHTLTVLRFTMRTQNLNMMFHFKWNAPAGTSDRTGLNTAMHVFWTNHLKAELTADLILQQITTVNLDSSSSPGSNLVIAGGEAGSDAGYGVPNNVALCVTEKSDFRGRNYRGRSYVPGVPVGVSASDEVVAAPAKIANIVNAFAWLMTAANTAAGIWSVVSKFLGNAPRAVGTSVPITAVYSDQYWDSQRRRLGGRGI